MKETIHKAYASTYWAHQWGGHPDHIVRNRNDLAESWGLCAYRPSWALTPKVRAAMAEHLDHVEWYRDAAKSVLLLFHEYDLRASREKHWLAMGFTVLKPLYSDSCTSYCMGARDLGTISCILSAHLLEDLGPLMRRKKAATD